MELKTAIEIFEYHQKWRLGEYDNMLYNPKELTEAFDIILKEIKKINLNKNESLKCNCKKSKFTRSVDENFNLLCGKCGRLI